MAKNICPGCKEVVLSFESDSSLRCSKCETEFEVIDESGEESNDRLTSE